MKYTEYIEVQKKLHLNLLIDHFHTLQSLLAYEVDENDQPVRPEEADHELSRPLWAAYKLVLEANGISFDRVEASVEDRTTHVWTDAERAQMRADAKQVFEQMQVEEADAP